MVIGENEIMTSQLKKDYKNLYEKLDKTIDYPTITNGNIDTWNDITYSLIIQGMIKRYPKKEYGELMGMAQNLTNTLFNALKKQYKNDK